jgi:hypothetical protein
MEKRESEARRKRRQTTQTYMQKVMRLIYKNVDGIEISANHRSTLEGPRNASLTYGEINVSSFLQILTLTGNTGGRKFVDLGCGTGKAVLCAAMSGLGFDRCCGIEIVSGLVEAALQTKDKLLEALKIDTSDDILQSSSSSHLKCKSSTSRATTELCLDDCSMIDLVKQILNSKVNGDDSNSHGNRSDWIPLEEVTNEFCRRHGHRVYRESLRHRGKLSSYLISLQVSQAHDKCDIKTSPMSSDL